MFLNSTGVAEYELLLFFYVLDKPFSRLRTSNYDVKMLFCILNHC